MNPYSRNNTNFGDDEIACILSKLPAESLQRFKIVHKSWCSIINDPYFIKLQIDESSSNIIATFVTSAKDSFHIVGIYSVKNESWRKIDTIPSGCRLFDQNPVSFYGTVNMMAARSVEGNGGSDFNEFVIISLIVADEKFVVTPVPPQYCGSQIKMSNFANRLYISGFVEMDFLVFSREKDGERWTWTSVMNIPTLGSFIGLGNLNCYLDDIIFLKENENILWKKMDGGFLEYDVRKKEI
ncbi:hypothetical protein KY285_010868 [Solanum tuberosum]|nr:hypothetical protein KY289_011443 [Solanum tuberosum]KAH0735161.1 hypothetical protein KY285_010868 [Solanum tuberosum]